MNEKLLIPLSIIIAGIIVAGAIFFGGSSAGKVAHHDNNVDAGTVPARVVSQKEDHIYGNPDADIFVIEYSDLECPYCRRYHEGASAQLKNRYAGDDRVAFVFRHFPLDEPYTDSTHERATEIHVAAECVAQLGGDEAFFRFIDDVFSSPIPASDEFDSSASDLPAELVRERAVKVGVDQAQFLTCYNNQDTEPILAADFEDGVRAGVLGTPTVMIQTEQGNTYLAVANYEALYSTIEAYLAE